MDDLRALFAAWSGVPAELLDGWDFHAHRRAGRPAAIAAMQGTEIHFAVAPEWRGRTIFRSVTRRFLEPLFERRGYLTTRVMAGEPHGRFLARLGFVKTSTRDGVEYYMLMALPFGRET